MALDISSDLLTLIPARGGSKGISGKNMHPLAGTPLIGWTIKQVINSDTPTRLAVTTDCADIAGYASSLGAEIVSRPVELASDSATSESALNHALEAIPNSNGVNHVMFLQATSPLRLAGTIDRAFQKYKDTHVDSVVGVVKSSPFHWRMEAGSSVALYDAKVRKRRQDFQPEDILMRETGSLYITKRTFLVKNQNRISGNIGLFEMDLIEGLDIDTLADLRIAEILIEEGFYDFNQ